MRRRLPSLLAAGAAAVLALGANLAEASTAVARAGLRKTVTFRKVDVVGASGTKQQIEALRSQPGAEYVEAGAQPNRFFQETSNRATRGLEATQTLTGADGSPLTGTGVSVAVIDSGVDLTHPYLREADGSSAVVANLKTLCEPTERLGTVQRVPASVDTDTLSAGGHGTHVNGIVAGRPTPLSSGEKRQGVAPMSPTSPPAAGRATSRRTPTPPPQVRTSPPRAASTSRSARPGLTEERAARHHQLRQGLPPARRGRGRRGGRLTSGIADGALGAPPVGGRLGVVHGGTDGAEPRFGPVVGRAGPSARAETRPAG